MNIQSEQWDLYKSRYDKLLWTIARKISGDLMTATLEDNYSELCIAALESIKGFHAKTGKTFEEMMEEKLFDQYTKTVLWNRKNKNGKKLTARMPFRNRVTSIDASSLDDGSSFDIEDTSINTEASSLLLHDMFKAVDEDTKKVLEAIVSDPSVIRPDGTLIVYGLLNPTGLSIHAAKRAVNNIERILNAKYNEN